jgi:hypothetical protein
MFWPGSSAPFPAVCVIQCKEKGRGGGASLTSHRPSSVARGYQTWGLACQARHGPRRRVFHSLRECGSRMRARFGKTLTLDSRRRSNYIGCLTVSVLTLLLIGHGGGTITTTRTFGPNVTQTGRVARELHVKTQHNRCHPAGGETKLEPRRRLVSRPAASAAALRVRVCASPASAIEAT